MIFALACDYILRILSDEIRISINDTSSHLRTSLRLIRMSHWSNVFVKCALKWILFNEIWILHITIRLDYERISFESVKIIQLWFMNWLTHQRTSRIWWIHFSQASSIMRSLENCSCRINRNRINNIIKMRMRLTIIISSIDSIDEMSMIVEMNHHLIDALNFIEMNFEINQMIDFQIVALRNALYATNLIVDQSIIQIRSEKIWKSVLQIAFRNLETIIVFINTSSSTRIETTRLTIMTKWFNILKNF
jgi:hypothetical protein